MHHGTPRTLFFLVFVASFFAVTAAVLFSVFGYRFSFERGIFIHSGSITIKSNPPDVSVSLDGVSLPESDIGVINNTIHIDGIIPGEHFLEVSAPQFQTWSKKVSVHSGLATEFWNILLPRIEYPRSTYPESARSLRAFPSPKTNLIALLREDEHQHALLLLDTDTGSTTSRPYDMSLHFPDDATANATWMPNAKRLVVPFDTESGERRTIVFDIETATEIDITEALGQAVPRNIRWNPAVSDSLLYLAGDNLFRLDLPETIGSDTVLSPPVTLATDVTAYDVSGDEVFFTTKDTLLIRFPADETEPEPETLAFLAGDLKNTPIQTLSVYDEDRVYLITESDTLIFLDRASETAENSLVLGSGVKHAQFSDDGKKLLFATDHEISVHFLDNWEVQPERKTGNTYQILRFAGSVSEVQWTEDYEHVLFLSDGSLLVAELDHRDRRNILPLLRDIGTSARVLSDFRENKIIVLPAPETQSPLFSVVFPEPLGFFGN